MKKYAVFFKDQGKLEQLTRRFDSLKTAYHYQENPNYFGKHQKYVLKLLDDRVTHYINDRWTACDWPLNDQWPDNVLFSKKLDEVNCPKCLEALKEGEKE